MDDDHDFHCRAALDKRWVTGHTPIGFATELAEGGVRVNRKRVKPPYERHFIAARRSRSNGRDCLRARRDEYAAAGPAAIGHPPAGGSLVSSASVPKANRGSLPLVRWSGAAARAAGAGVVAKVIA